MRKSKGHYKSEVFDGHYTEFTAKILPDFGVKTDKQVEEDQELMGHYLVMKSEHDQARASTRNYSQSTRQNNSYNNNSFDRRNASRS